MKTWFDDCLHLLLSADRAGLQRLFVQIKAEGLSPDRILLDILSPALNTVGELWSRQQAALSQVYMAGRLAEEALPSLLPLSEEQPYSRGLVLMGNAPEDNHGLGRQIVSSYLRTAGLKVVDLGLNVPAEVFVEQAMVYSATIVAISALMVHTATKIAEIRSLLDRRGAHEVKILVGGAPFNFDPELYRNVGATAMGRDAGEAVSKTLALLEVS